MKVEESNNRKAVALRYEKERDEAPRVVAKGEGYLALAIEKLAQETGVPVVKDEVLVQYLGALKLYEEIPPFLYQAVAEILAFVYRLERERNRGL